MNSKEDMTWQTRFELKEIEKRNDGVVCITVTVLSRVPGTEVYDKGNYRYTETFSNKYWFYKDGKLFDVIGWNITKVEFTERTPETDFVLAAIKARGYN
jgi:hypothetical protein